MKIFQHFCFPSLAIQRRPGENVDIAADNTRRAHLYHLIMRNRGYKPTLYCCNIWQLLELNDSNKRRQKQTPYVPISV